LNATVQPAGRSDQLLRVRDVQSPVSLLTLLELPRTFMSTRNNAGANAALDGIGRLLPDLETAVETLVVAAQAWLGV
jgi:hypothetical protein